VSLAPNTVYLIPPKKVLAVRGGALQLSERGTGLTLPVDVLFRSLAEDLGERAAGVVLSGTGSDGMRGVRALHEAGGLVVVQEPSTAKFDGMPRAAMSVGIADYVLPVSEIPEYLRRYADRAEHLKNHPVAPEHADDEGPFDQLTGILRRQTGVDFSKYKPTTVTRRIQRRMVISQVDTIEEYLALARQSPREVAALFKELLISVTKFFRDADAFELLRREVIPAIVERTRPGEGVRAWVAGCATGEEAYSLAMLFEEYFESGGRPRDVKIFATDIDRDALEFAGAGIYPESIAADVAPERLNRFFVRRGETFQVARFLRQRVVFANHDISKDPPFSRVSLVTCRNLLIYFSAPLQTQVLSGFKFALRPGGFLFLGSSETPGELGDELSTVDSGAKVYRRTDARSRATDLRRAPLVPVANGGASSPASQAALPLSSGQNVADAFNVLVESYAPPSALITEQFDVLHLFGQPSEQRANGELLPSAVCSRRGQSESPLAASSAGGLHGEPWRAPRPARRRLRRVSRRVHGARQSDRHRAARTNAAHHENARGEPGAREEERPGCARGRRGLRRRPAADR
jgi:two-component system CheB/CheR fusion protein